MEYGKGFFIPKPGQYTSEGDLKGHVLSRLDQWFEIEQEVPGRHWGGDKTRIDAVLRPREPEGWGDDETAIGVEFKLPSTDTSVGKYFQWAAQAADYVNCDWRGYGRLQVFLCPSPLMMLYHGGPFAEQAQQRRENRSSLEWHQRTAQLMAKVLNNDVEDSEDRAAIQLQDALVQFEAEDREAKIRGYVDALHLEQSQRQLTAWMLAKMLGQFGVGELMPHQGRGWMLLRSGDPVWSERGGPRRRSLKPRTGSR